MKFIIYRSSYGSNGDVGENLLLKPCDEAVLDTIKINPSQYIMDYFDYNDKYYEEDWGKFAILKEKEDGTKEYYLKIFTIDIGSTTDLLHLYEKYGTIILLPPSDFFVIEEGQNISTTMAIEICDLSIEIY